MNLQTIAIVGVGLIGGSIGLAVRERGLAERVVGIGRRPESLRKAKSMGACDRGTTDLPAGVAEADLVVVCTPVALIAEQVLEVSRHCPRAALITDAGSTKQRICQQVDRELRGTPIFVGSHPVAGSEKSGPQYARADLFQDRVVVVTPTRRSPESATKRIETFWRRLGAKVLRKTPQMHDRLLASTSHLPHLVASVLSAATPTSCLPLVGGGWEDTTRVAAGDADLWRQILLENRENVLASLDRFLGQLTSMRESLAKNDARAITKILETGRQKRESLGS